MTDEFVLLQEYAGSGSQSAFAEVARRYIDVVYSAAKRQVRNDPHLAEDVTQAVFFLLAQRANSIPPDRPLSGWLLKVTGYCAANARRKRDRQQWRDRRAGAMKGVGFLSNDRSDAEPDWELLAPLLDQGMSKLPAADRDALVLRFMEQKSLRQIGQALGISEDAAHKRVSRAVDKLRKFFHRKGVVTMSAGALAAALASHSVHAAPPALLASVTAGVSTAGAPAAGISLAKGALWIMAVQKTKLAVIVVALALLSAGGLAVGFHAMWSSPRQHTVTLAPQKGALDSRSSVTFTGGSSVRVMGMTEIRSASSGGVVNGLLGAIGITVSQPSTRPTKWWGADGAASVPVSLAGLGNVMAGDVPGHRQVRFVFALAGPNMNDGSLDIRVPGVSSTAESSNTIGGERWINLAVSLPNNTKQAAIRMGWADGAWRDDDVTPIAELMQKASTTQPATSKPSKGEIEYGAVSEEAGRTVVEMISSRRSVGDAASRVDVILKDGKRLGCDEMQGFPTGRQVLKFPAALGKVDRIVWSSRPYEWRTLDNVVLQPPANSVPSNVAQR